MKDLKKFTAQELLNLKDGKSQEVFLNESTFSLTGPDSSIYELITDVEDRNNFDPHNWVHYGSATVSVFRNALKFVTDGTSSGADQGVQLDLAYIVGQDSTASIEAGNTYLLKCTLDNTAGKTTPKIRAVLGGGFGVFIAADGDPADGTINTTLQEYYTHITTSNNTGSLYIYQPADDNDASGTTVEIDDITLSLVGGGLNTKHTDVSGANNLLVYSNRRDWLFSFSTYEKDITGVRGGNTTGGTGANMVSNPDFESSSSQWSGILYQGASGSGGVKDAANTSNPIAGTKDLKMTNAAGKIIGIYPNIVGSNNNYLYSGQTFKVTFKYKTNFDGEGQPDPLNVRVIGTGPYGGYSTTIAGDYTMTSDFKELTTNGNFTADADDADLQGTGDLTGWSIAGAHGGNSIALASGVLTYTIADGSINTYIRTATPEILQPGVRYLVRIVVDSVSGTYPIFERGGGQDQVKMQTAGTHEFIWQHDEEAAGDAVIRRASNLTGNFAISSITIRPYDVAGRPFIHGLENGGDLTQAAVEASFMFQADGNGYRNILFYMDNTGSTDSIFQIDDVRVQKIENHTLRWSSNDFFMTSPGTYLIPVPDLGPTIYFNVINDWVPGPTQFRICKL